MGLKICLKLSSLLKKKVDIWARSRQKHCDLEGRRGSWRTPPTRHQIDFPGASCAQSLITLLRSFLHIFAQSSCIFPLHHRSSSFDDLVLHTSILCFFFFNWSQKVGSPNSPKPKFAQFNSCYLWCNETKRW